MSKARLILSPQQIKELRMEAHKCKDVPTFVRFQAVLMYGTGYTLQQITDITGLASATVHKYWYNYHQQGSAGLSDGRKRSSKSKLSHTNKDELRIKLRQKTPVQVFPEETSHVWTITHLRKAVEMWYGVVYQSDTSYQKLFKTCGFFYDPVARRYKPKVD